MVCRWKQSEDDVQRSNENESGWELRSEILYQSFLNSHASVKWEQELHESWWELRSESLYESFLNSHASVKREQELHESWEARFCMRVFSTLMPRSNENKSCMRVDESWEARFCIRVFSTLMPLSNENKSCMRVEKRDFVWEFSQLSCPCQTRTRVAWELRSEILYESFFNSHASVKREQELHESWWELRSEILYESFLNSHAPVKREQELHESWEARFCMRVLSTLMPLSNENKSCMRVEKRDFVWEFFQLSCLGQTRTRVAWELMRVEKRDFVSEFSQLSCPCQTRTRVAWELRSEILYESFLNSHAPVKREQELHESWEARFCMRVFSTLMPLSNENKSCMRVEKRDFVWEFFQLSCLGQTRTRVAWELMRVEKRDFVWEFSQLSCPCQTRTRVAWELRSEILYESSLNSHAPVKREQELHESWEARFCMRVFSTLMPRSNENKSCVRVDESWEARFCIRVFSTLMPLSNENKSCMRVEKRDFVWEFSQLSCPCQTRTRVAWELRSEILYESFFNSHASVKREQELHESWWELRSEILYQSFLNSHAPVKREQELHESWEARFCMRVFSTLMPLSNENKSCMRVEKRDFVWEFFQLSCLGQTRTRVAWELMRVEKRDFVWEFSQLSCPCQTRTRVAWELRSEILYESSLNSHAPVKREQELHESWEARFCMRVFSTLMPRSNENKSCMRVDESWEARFCIRVFSTLMPLSNENKSCMRVEKRDFVWEFSQLSCPCQTRTRVAWELRSEILYESFFNSHASVKREQELHESWWELRSEILYQSFLNSHAPVKREQELHESWEARFCMRVFSTLMPRSNENKSCMRVDESWEARFCMRVFSTLMPLSNENKSCMRVEKRDFVWEFSQLSCPCQTRTRVAWELRSEILYESFFNSHASVKREQELHESWWELRSEILYESFLNSHAPVKREQELHESWEARFCTRVFSTLMLRSNENKSCMRVDWITQPELSLTLNESALESMNWWSNLSENCNSRQLSSSFNRGLILIYINNSHRSIRRRLRSVLLHAIFHAQFSPDYVLDLQVSAA